MCIRDRSPALHAHLSYHYCGNSARATNQGTAAAAPPINLRHRRGRLLVGAPRPLAGRTSTHPCARVIDALDGGLLDDFGVEGREHEEGEEHQRVDQVVVQLWRTITHLTWAYRLRLRTNGMESNGRATCTRVWIVC
eukprot:4699438-Prymnesium_polylepis.1